MTVDADGLIKMSEGIKIHYKGTLDNISFLKRQQWTITNHALVLYGAVVALTKDTSQIERMALSGLAVAGCLFALWCMFHTQKSMTRYYRNLYEAHQAYFTAEEREKLKLHRDEPGFLHNGSFIVGLMVANVLAFSVGEYFMWVKNGLPVLHAIAKTCEQIVS
jgi:hypothetical protein